MTKISKGKSAISMYCSILQEFYYLLHFREQNIVPAYLAERPKIIKIDVARSINYVLLYDVVTA
jgi:hypothetical protein